MSPQDELKQLVEYLRDEQNSRGDMNNAGLAYRDAADRLQSLLAQPQAPALTELSLDCYDAGLLPEGKYSDEWWRQVLRSTLAAAHEFYQQQVNAALSASTPGAAPPSEPAPPQDWTGVGEPGPRDEYATTYGSSMPGIMPAEPAPEVDLVNESRQWESDGDRQPTWDDCKVSPRDIELRDKLAVVIVKERDCIDGRGFGPSADHIADCLLPVIDSWLPGHDAKVKLESFHAGVRAEQKAVQSHLADYPDKGACDWLCTTMEGFEEFTAKVRAEAKMDVFGSAAIMAKSLDAEHFQTWCAMRVEELRRASRGRAEDETMKRQVQKLATKIAAQLDNEGLISHAKRGWAQRVIRDTIARDFKLLLERELR